MLQFFPRALLSMSQNEMSQTEMKQLANRGLLPFMLLTVPTQELLHLLFPLYVCCTTTTKNGPFQRRFHWWNLSKALKALFQFRSSKRPFVFGMANDMFSILYLDCCFVFARVCYDVFDRLTVFKLDSLGYPYYSKMTLYKRHWF